MDRDDRSEAASRSAPNSTSSCVSVPIASNTPNGDPFDGAEKPPLEVHGIL